MPGRRFADPSHERGEFVAGSPRPAPCPASNAAAGKTGRLPSRRLPPSHVTHALSRCLSQRAAVCESGANAASSTSCGRCGNALQHDTASGGRTRASASSKARKRARGAASGPAVSRARRRCDSASDRRACSAARRSTGRSAASSCERCFSSRRAQFERIPTRDRADRRTPGKSAAASATSRRLRASRRFLDRYGSRLNRSSRRGRVIASPREREAERDREERRMAQRIVDGRAPLQNGAHSNGSTGQRKKVAQHRSRHARAGQQIRYRRQRKSSRTRGPFGPIRSSRRR